MSVHDDDLLPELRHSADPADRRLARLLGRLSGSAAPVPRASGELTAFLAEAESAAAPHATSPVIETVPVPADDLVVQLGQAAPRSSPMRSRFLVPLNKVLKTGLLAKVMLGTTVALTGVGAAAAATGNIPGTGDDNVVVITPASDTGGSTPTSDDPLGVIDLDDQTEDADEGADDDGPGDDPDEPGDDDTTAGAAAAETDDADDDQGDDADDQGEDADDQGQDEPGDDADEPDDDADDDEPDDDSDDADEDSSGPGGDDSEDDDSGSGEDDD